MIRSFRSEWITLRRRGFIIGWLGPILLFTFVGTIIGITGIDQVGGDRGPFGDVVGIDQYLSPDGLALGLQAASTIVGLVVLSLFAMSLGREYSSGTIRLLLVSEPRRSQLLAGKLLALSSFTALAIIAAAVFSIVIGFTVAPSQDISTAEWVTGEAVVGIIATAGRMIVATIAWGLVGATVVMASRSSAIAIAVGAGGLILVPRLLGQANERLTDRFPDSAFRALTAGGNGDLSLSASAVMTVVYAAICVAILFTIFRTRDVTD